MYDGTGTSNGVSKPTMTATSPRTGIKTVIYRCDGCRNEYEVPMEERSQWNVSVEVVGGWINRLACSDECEDQIRRTGVRELAKARAADRARRKHS